MSTPVRIFKAGQSTLSSTAAAQRCLKVSCRIHPPRLSRALSSTPRHHAQWSDMDPKAMANVSSKQMQSNDKENSKMMDASKIKYSLDVGLLPITFIKPESSQLPAWTKHPSRRFNIEWFYVRCRFRDFVGYEKSFLMFGLSCVQKLTSLPDFGPSCAIMLRKIQ